MSAIKPPAKTPSACALKYAVKARLATDSEVPKALVNATTEKLLMPLPDRLISAKKPVRPMIVGVKIEVIPSRRSATARAGCCGAVSLSALRASTSGTATTSARMPAAISATFNPAPAAIAIIVTGATALPRNPAKVWIEKARPSRGGAILADSSA